MEIAQAVIVLKVDAVPVVVLALAGRALVVVAADSADRSGCVAAMGNVVVQKVAKEIKTMVIRNTPTVITPKRKITSIMMQTRKMATKRNPRKNTPSVSTSLVLVHSTPTMAVTAHKVALIAVASAAIASDNTASAAAAVLLTS